MMVNDTQPIPLEDTEPTKPITTMPLSQTSEPNGSAPIPLPARAPWLLQQFIDGEISEVALDAQMSSRFPNMPVLSTISFRHDKRGRYDMAMLATQDGAAMMLVEFDHRAQATQFSFTIRSMLTLRYALPGLTRLERERWLETMRLYESRMAFLWGQKRWESNYLLALTHKYHTNVYAFSPHHFESAARLTTEVTRQLVDWLDTCWQPPANGDTSPLNW